MSKNILDRRDFLRTAGRAGAAALAAGALPTIVSPRALGGAKGGAPSDRIRLGVIGARLQGSVLMKSVFASSQPSEIVAVCDVDSEVRDAAREMVEKHTKKSPATYHDYRKLLDDPQIDAVIIATPDHWHALPTVDACHAGKDVYCEKPLSLTVAEGRAMVAAAQKNSRILQTGSKQRSDDHFRIACEMVRDGKIGKVHAIKVGINKVNFKGTAVPDGDPPSALDYDFWLGPAPRRAYNPNHVHYNFRFFWDYSGGQLTNWGAHHLDIAQWGLNRDSSGPVSIEAEARYDKDHLYEVPEWCRVLYRYDDGVEIVCSQDERSGTTFIGEKGTIYVDRGKFEAEPDGLVTDKLPLFISSAEMGNRHVDDWLSCIRTRERPICDAMVGHRSATICHLGNIAIRSGRPVTWDPDREEITGDEEQAAMLSRPYRAPWMAPTPTGA